MASVNKVILAGNLVKDPEVHHLHGYADLCRLYDHVRSLPSPNPDRISRQSGGESVINRQRGGA